MCVCEDERYRFHLRRTTLNQRSGGHDRDNNAAALVDDRRVPHIEELLISQT